MAQMDMIYAQEKKFFKDLHNSGYYRIADFPPFCKWFEKKYNRELATDGEKVYGKYGYLCLINYYDLEW